jgi:transcriptional regulator with XRE-family HTH domain
MSTKKVDHVTAAQIRAARGLVGMTQSALAQASKLGLSTVVDFERSRREVSLAAAASMRKALERVGVEFIDQNGSGPGVRLRKRN